MKLVEPHRIGIVMCSVLCSTNIVLFQWENADRIRMQGKASNAQRSCLFNRPLAVSVYELALTCVVVHVLNQNARNADTHRERERRENQAKIVNCFIYYCLLGWLSLCLRLIFMFARHNWTLRRHTHIMVCVCVYACDRRWNWNYRDFLLSPSRAKTMSLSTSMQCIALPGIFQIQCIGSRNSFT